ncbi:unnamed protein product [Paramecium sonneborni]|uniref:Transmembrane protein n=1 Tax=Paramecium sonneborni TaxID=65129 RepID=A0A8S1RPZ0_9CILI|nr:unnamed protein product [Paramecium sonneborni]
MESNPKKFKDDMEPQYNFILKEEQKTEPTFMEGNQQKEQNQQQGTTNASEFKRVLFLLIMMILDYLQHLLYKPILFRVVCLKKIISLAINQVDKTRVNINKLVLLNNNNKNNKIKNKLIHKIRSHHKNLNLIIIIIKVSEIKEMHLLEL